MKPKEDITRVAARGSWAPRSGLGSFLCKSALDQIGCNERHVLEDKKWVESQDDWITVRQV